MAVKEYFIKCPEHPGVTTMIGTSNKKYQAEIEGYIKDHKISDETILVAGKSRIISALNKKFEGGIKEDINGEISNTGVGKRKNGK
jgi:hypothetical protein